MKTEGILIEALLHEGTLMLSAVDGGTRARLTSVGAELLAEATGPTLEAAARECIEALCTAKVAAINESVGRIASELNALRKTLALTAPDDEAADASEDDEASQ